MASQAAFASPATPQTRLQVLDPFIAALHRTLEDPARERRDGGTVCLRVSGKELTVDPWTNEKLDPRFRSDDPLVCDCSRVVTQSVALLTKCAKDLAVLEEQGSGSMGGLYSARAELMLDAAIGGSLVKDIQRIIDELLREGLREEASGLSKFRHQLRHTVYDLRKQVSPEQRSTVETLADQMRECPAERCPGEAAAPERRAAPAESPAPAPRRPLPGDPSVAASRRPRPPRRGADEHRAAAAEAGPHRRGRVPLRTAALSILLIGTSLVLLAARRPGSPSPERAMGTALERSSFPAMVSSIDERLHSLYVTVDESAWSKLDDERRIEFVRGLAGPLPTARYSGFLVRTAEGRPVAQWLSTTGATLLEDRVEERESM